MDGAGRTNIIQAKKVDFGLNSCMILNNYETIQDG